MGTPGLPSCAFAYRCIIACCVILLATFLTIPDLYARDISIGVLAKRGNLKTSQRWQPIADYLSQTIPEHTFHIHPLSFRATEEAAHNNSIDFVLTNPGMYVKLQTQEGVSRIATLKNDIDGKAVTTFGSVVFVKSTRTEIRTLEDAVGKRVAAVDPLSFGGWITAWYQFRKNNMYPLKDFKRLDFLGTHDAVVYAILNGRYDVGIVRTDTLERMASEGKLALNEIRSLYEACEGPRPDPELLPCTVMRSTDLYPEWPFAKIKATPSALAERVAVALVSMPEDHPNARRAKIRGWTIPANYQPVHETLRKLKIPPYAHLNNVSAADAFNQFKFEIIGAAVTLLILAALLLRNMSLTHNLRESRERLRHMARYDALTDLPNRRYFEEFAGKHLYQAERERRLMGLLFVDLDGFKLINDTHGHAVGDQVLIEVANRLSLAVRKGDLVARCGGDEFLILMVNVRERKDLQDAAIRVLDSIQQPMFIHNKELTIGTSIGIACYPNDGDTVEDLLRRSDSAMYAVKQAGRCDYAFYDATVHAPIMD